MLFPSPPTIVVHPFPVTLLFPDRPQTLLSPVLSSLTRHCGTCPWARAAQKQGNVDEGADVGIHVSSAVRQRYSSGTAAPPPPCIPPSHLHECDDDGVNSEDHPQREGGHVEAGEHSEQRPSDGHVDVE